MTEAPLPYPPHDMATRKRKDVFSHGATFTKAARHRISSLKAKECYVCGGELLQGAERFWVSGKGVKALECGKCNTYFLPPNWSTLK